MKFSTLFILIFSNFSSFCTTDVSDDLARVVGYYNPRPECLFNYTQVNSKTIKKFPKCDRVYGILVFNEKTDLTVPQLSEHFKNMTVLFGGLLVENTKFENISFFPKSQESYLHMYYGIYVRNNSKLTDYKLLTQMFMYSDKNLKECEFQVVDNKKLDAENLCGSGLLHYFTDLRVKGNLKDCGCQGDEIVDTTLSTYKTCQNSYNGLYLNNVTSKDFSSLENIMQVKGIIDISDTNIENLSFLKNLVTFKYRNQGTKERVSFNLQNNPKMTRFGMPVLSVIHNTEVERSDGPEEGIVLFNFENLHPDFCLTVNEILLFLELNVTFRNLNAKICDVSQEILSEPSVCKFETLEKLHGECIFVIGDVTIDSENEHDIINMGNVYYIFGSLTIKNTKLQSLAYFFNLMAIVHLGDGSAIQLISNKELKDAKFDNLRSIITSGNREAFIQDNHPDIFKSSGGNCTISDPENIYIAYRTRLNFTGTDCDGSRIEEQAETGAVTGPPEQQPAKETENDNSCLSISLGVVFVISFLL